MICEHNIVDNGWLEEIGFTLLHSNICIIWLMFTLCAATAFANDIYYSSESAWRCGWVGSRVLLWVYMLRAISHTAHAHVFDAVCTAFRIFHKANWIKPLLIRRGVDRTMDNGHQRIYAQSEFIYEHQITNIYLILLFEYLWMSFYLSNAMVFDCGRVLFVYTQAL